MSLTPDQDRLIGDLIDQVQAAAASADNRARGKQRPTVTFGLEDPIAQAKIFQYDVNDLFADPVYYLAEMLRQKLWRWRTWPQDPTPLNAEVSAWLGHYPEYPGLGLDLTFNREGVPLVLEPHPLERDPDLSLLKPYELHDFTTWGWQPRILRWHDDLTRLAAGRIDVSFGMIWWRGCLDLAVQMRSYEALLADTAERPDFVHDLLKWLVEQRCRWWEGYWKYFGLTPGPCPVADDWINVPFISPRIFREFVLPRYLDIEAFHGGITGIHSCGNTAPLQKDLLRITSLKGLESSAWTDLQQSVRNVPPDKHLGVVLHPNDVLVASRQEMADKLRSIVATCGERSYSIGTSGLTPITPNPQDFYDQIQMWTEVVAEVFAPLRGLVS